MRAPNSAVTRALHSDFSFHSNEIATVGKGNPSAQEACFLPESWLRLVADLRLFCLILPRSASVSD